MFTIGDFARHGRVSVRMLRHYDTIGLLRPVHVDPQTGYRHYEAWQLSTLNRIVALKELGFTLNQVAAIVADKVEPLELRGMLRLRQAELAERIAADTARLTQIEARLAAIETEGAMPALDIQVKRIAPVRVAELAAPAAGFEPTAIAPVIGPLFVELARRLGEADIAVDGPAIAYYDHHGVDGSSVLVHAAMPVHTDLETDITIVDLPGIEQAATVVHQGSMTEVMTSVQTLARWIDDNGYRSAGLHREITLAVSEDHRPIVTELQEPITR